MRWLYVSNPKPCVQSEATILARPAAAAVAAPVRIRAGACGRLVSRPSTASGDRVGATVTRCFELLAVRALERGSALAAVRLSHDEWSQARWPSCRGMKGRLGRHVCRRRHRRLQHVTTPRHAGEELTSSGCATPHSTCAWHIVRGRRSRAYLGRLSGLRRRRSPPPRGKSAMCKGM